MKKILLKNLINKLESGKRPKGGVDRDLSGIPSLGAEHLDDRGGFKLEKIKYIPEDYFISLSKGKISLHDILIVKDGATTGKISFVDEEFPYKKAAINEHLFKLEANIEKVHSGYLFRFLSSDFGQKQILSDFRGATVGGISRNFVNRIRVPIPPFSDQKRITSILDFVDGLRQKRHQAIDMLDEFLRAIFLDMFGDPVKNTKKWQYVRLDDVSDMRLGKMLDKKKQTRKHKRPYLRNANVLWGYIDITDLYEMDFDENDRKKYSLKQGDVLICEGGEVGRSAVWRNQLQECYFQKALHRLRPDINKIHSDFIVYLMWFYAKKGGLKDYVSSVTIQHLTGIKLKSLKIPLPPIELQLKFAEIVQQVETIREKMQKSLEEMDNLFHSLMQRAFKGKLNLNEDAVDSLIDRKMPTANLHEPSVVEEIGPASIEEIIKLHHMVRCVIKDYSEKIEVEYELLMQLEDIDKYKAKQFDTYKCLDDWVREKLDIITQNALFDKRYVDILLDFEKPEEFQDTLKVIKYEMQQLTESIGYTVKHLIVQPILTPLLLKRNGFMVQKTGDFSTLNNKVKVSLDIVVTGIIRDLSKIPQHIRPGKNIIKEMEQLIYDETEKQMQKVAPEKFYMPFKFPEEESIEDTLKIGIKERIANIFFASDVNVLIKRLETDLIARILNLINGNPYYLDIEFIPLGSVGSQKIIALEVEFLVETVNNWDTFIYNDFESHSQEIDEIKDTLREDISANFQIALNKVLRYSKDYRKLMEIARKSQYKITNVFGLDTRIVNIKPKTTMDVKEKSIGLESLKVDKDHSEIISIFPGGDGDYIYKRFLTETKPKFTDVVKYSRYTFRNKPFRFSDLMDAVKDETTDYEKMKELIFNALRDGLGAEGEHLEQCFFEESFDSGDEKLNDKLRGTVGFRICENK